MALAIALTLFIYWPGLYGGWLFDDYPNIVDNKGVQPEDAALPSLVRAALSSPASELKRPLASLSFAFNYLLTGLDPFWMKLVNLLIHVLNGVLVFWLVGKVLSAARDSRSAGDAEQSLLPALIAGGWMILPINVTCVLYVVQRMESMANAFVLLGLVGYVSARIRMLAPDAGVDGRPPSKRVAGLFLCVASVAIPTGLGLLAKETAVMLPLYAFLAEWALFRFCAPAGGRDRRILALYLVLLALPICVGLAWLVPNLLRPEVWATRDFTLGTRLLSETRIVLDYARWVLLPTPSALAFYHDDFNISSGLLSPPATLLSALCLLALTALCIWIRSRKPLVALGLAWFLGAQLLTGTVLPLELVYEHRNYFASLGLLLAIVPELYGRWRVHLGHSEVRLGRVAFAGFLAWWAILTAQTAAAWSAPLELATELAHRAPDSPRAQYELGRTYIIYSHYDPASPFTRLAYAPLERAARMPKSSILPQQALIFMNSRMRLPLKDEWWESMIAKLRSTKPGVQDESSLAALSQCAKEHHCDLPDTRMSAAFKAAVAHPSPSARILAIYSDYAWSVQGQRALGERLIDEAIKANPGEPAYRITRIYMLLARGEREQARVSLDHLQQMNIGGSLDSAIATLRPLVHGSD